MANRFPYGPSTQLPGMVTPLARGVPVPVSIAASQPYHVMPQQYYHHGMTMTTPSMVQVNVPNEMQQGIYHMTVHPNCGHGYRQPVTPGYGAQPKGPMTEEQRRWLDQQQSQIKERLLRERDFQKQQQRLRDFSMGPPGGQKLEADKLIRSMFGATDDQKVKHQRPSGQNAKPPARAVDEASTRLPGAASGFQASQKARDWSNLGDLHDVFSGPNTSDFPAWCQAGAPVPPIYTQVENYVTRNGVIDTSLLYPVLVSSGLSRETLGQIWSLANRHTPGLLDKSELYAALAFVALAQNACQITTIDILHALHQAPVPLLNQVAAAPPPAAHSTPDPMEPPIQPIVNSAAADDDDFDDFKSATHVPSLGIIPPAGALSNSLVGSRLAHHTLTHSPGVINNSDVLRVAGTDDFSDFQQAAAMMPAAPSSVVNSVPTADSSSLSIPEKAPRGHQRTHSEPDRLQTALDAKPRTANDVLVGGNSKCSDGQGGTALTVFRSQFGAVGFGEQSVISRGTDDLMGAAEAEDKYSVFRELAATSDQPRNVDAASSSVVDEDDDFGDFLSSTAIQSQVISSIPATSFSPSLLTPFGSRASPVSDFRAFHGKQETLSLSDFEFTDFQSAAIVSTEEKPSSSLSSLISQLHGFHIGSAAVADVDFGDFIAPPPCDSPSSGSNSVTSGQKDSKEVDQLSNGDKIGSKSTPSFESQSVSSLDFVTGDFPLGVESEPYLGRHGSIPSLDLRVSESPEQEAESGIEFMVGPNPRDSLAKNEISDSRQSFTPMMLTGQSLVDRYSLIRNDVPSHTDVHSYEWQRCLDKCHQVIGDAFKIFNGISNSNVSNEVIGSEEGENYLKDLIEIYRISRRISVSIKMSRGIDLKIRDTIDHIEAEWNKLLSFVMSSPVIPDEGSFNFSAAVLEQTEESLKRACGICLLDVDSSSNSHLGESECFKLTYGGRQYHSACANFWVNFVDSLLPSLAFKHNLL